MERKMIISDMDGTLMPSPDYLPERNADVLRRACDAGVLVVLASARPYGMLKEVHDAVCPEMPVVCLNGARIYDQYGNPICENDIDEDTVTSIFDALENKENLSNIVIEYGNTLSTLTPPKSPYMREEAKCVGNIQLDINNLPKSPASRLMLYTTNEEYGNYISEICKKFAAPKYIIRLRVFEGTKRTTYRYEISHHKSNKWDATCFVAEKYGIKPENIWAFGDEWNDVEMISNAAHGYAIKGSTADGCGSGSTESVADTIEKDLLL